MFLNFINNLPSRIDPVLFSVGSFEVRWYSLSYLVAFSVVFFLVYWRIRKGEFPHQKFDKEKSDFAIGQKLESDKIKIRNIFSDIFMVAVVGLVLGARIGYGFFYDFELILKPWRLFSPFIESNFIGIYGMSFFGGLVGVFLGIFIYGRVKKINLRWWLNFITPAVPLGYFFGRLGNFLNGELYGRITEKGWGMSFPLSGDNFLRHPSQLYEAFFEGIIIFLILWSLRNKRGLQNKLFPLFLILYGTARFLIEFVREENFFGFFTTGQYLSLVIILIGTGEVFYLKSKK